MTERNALPNHSNAPSYGDGNIMGGSLQPSILFFRFALSLLSLLVRQGRVQLQYRDLWQQTLGNGEGFHYRMQVDSLRLFPALLANTELGLGEAYINGWWHLEGDDLADLIGVLLQNHEAFGERATVRFAEACRNLIKPKHRHNTPSSSRRNVAHHYDIGNDLYQAFLDEGMNYSCAFLKAQPRVCVKLN